jgi:hypothetical protein
VSPYRHAAYVPPKKVCICGVVHTGRPRAFGRTLCPACKAALRDAMTTPSHRSYWPSDATTRETVLAIALLFALIMLLSR